MEDGDFVKGSFGEKITWVITGASQFAPVGDGGVKLVLEIQMSIHRKMFLKTDQIYFYTFP
jgi:hypothetical protein